MEDPRSMSPGSIMPPYPWLLSQKLDLTSLPARIGALRKVGVPYPAGAEATAQADAQAQADKITASLKTGLVADAKADREIIALIAYLQRLGTDIKAAPAAPATPAAQVLAPGPVPATAAVVNNP
jgi:cytochrome c oxidase cbb3-type subunit I/II